MKTVIFSIFTFLFIFGCGAAITTAVYATGDNDISTEASSPQPQTTIPQEPPQTPSSVDEDTEYDMVDGFMYGLLLASTELNECTIL